jgi:hypothetical protein
MKMIGRTGVAIAAALIAIPMPLDATDIAWRQTAAMESEIGNDYTRKGTAELTTGDQATVAVKGTNGPWNSDGSRVWNAQIVYSFVDGSGFTVAVAGTVDQGTMALRGTGEFVAGAGRFQGIKGNLTMTGRGGDVAWQNWVGSYSLPSK